MPPSLEITEGVLQVETVSNGSFATVKAPTYSENIHMTRSILIRHTKWQLNEVSQQMFRGSRERKPEATGNKNSFSRIMGLTDQTLQVLCFCSFMEVSLPRPIHNPSHLKRAVLGEGMQTLKNGVCQVAEKICLGFSIAPTI